MERSSGGVVVVLFSRVLWAYWPAHLSQMLIRLQDMVRRGEIIDNDTEDEFYLRRLDAGLFVLQHICYIMAEICNANVPQVGGAAPDGPVHACLLPGPCLGGDSVKDLDPLSLTPCTLCGPAPSGVGARCTLSTGWVLVSARTNSAFPFSPPPPPDSPEGSPDPKHAGELHQNRQAHHQG